MILEKTKRIKAFIMDVDGTLTDGKIYMGPSGEVMKAFSVKDGLGIKKLLQTNIIPIILTGRTSDITLNRAKELGITEVYQGIEDKVVVLQEIIEKLGCSNENVLYMGDDENDLACMELSGVVAVPSDACASVKEVADYVCSVSGGCGAVREVIELIL